MEAQKIPVYAKAGNIPTGQLAQKAVDLLKEKQPRELRLMAGNGFYRAATPTNNAPPHFGGFVSAGSASLADLAGLLADVTAARWPTRISITKVEENLTGEKGEKYKVRVDYTTQR